MSPDLILLDIMMPNVDGFEVCKKLKENDNTKDIPIIFLTALNDTEILVKGFQLGGVDYIIKPFKQNELLIRIETHIELKRARDTIVKQYKQLQALIKEKNDIVSLAAHDLKTPATVIMGFAKMIMDRFEQMPKEQILEFAEYMYKSGDSVIKIIANLVDLNALEEDKLLLKNISFNVDELIFNSIEYFNVTAKEKKISLAFKEDKQDLKIVADPNIVRQIIDNLISNAIKFSPFDSSVRIKSYKVDSTEAGRDYVRIEVSDNGQGIKAEEMDMLFQKFAKLSSKPTGGESSSGLGLSIVKSLLDKIDGRVWCESVENKGSTFIVELPVEINED
jgi:signal transduction histidine kinase